MTVLVFLMSRFRETPGHLNCLYRSSQFEVESKWEGTLGTLIEVNTRLIICNLQSWHPFLESRENFSGPKSRSIKLRLANAVKLL